MGIIRDPQKVKLFTGIIAVSEELAIEALGEFEERYGAIDIKTPHIKFDFTDYYETEMGRNLLRQWAGFETLMDPSRLSEIKAFSNNIENKYSVSGKRRVNLDPGYITPAKVVLASSKDFSHRIYLLEGIYAEITLMYKHKKFIPLEWTYPDYKSGTALEFFDNIRNAHQAALKNLR